MLVAGKFAWVPHVKLPVKCLWYSGKFTCACRQFACILREVVAASAQVNLPVFTGKLHVTQVNCVWGLFTCELELQVKLPAFAGNFARASFTVHPSGVHHFPSGSQNQLKWPHTKQNTVRAIHCLLFIQWRNEGEGKASGNTVFAGSGRAQYPSRCFFSALEVIAIDCI